MTATLPRAKPIPLHKALRNLERAYTAKCKELEQAEQHIHDLQQQLKEKQK